VLVVRRGRRGCFAGLASWLARSSAGVWCRGWMDGATCGARRRISSRVISTPRIRTRSGSLTSPTSRPMRLAVSGRGDGFVLAPDGRLEHARRPRRAAARLGMMASMGSRLIQPLSRQTETATIRSRPVRVTGDEPAPGPVGRLGRSRVMREPSGRRSESPGYESRESR
jgi:hypothetical protein